MSELLKKSKENIDAADLLIASRKYASSVHCSYYSLLQKAQQIVFTLTGKSLGDLVAGNRIANKPTSSHSALRLELLQLVKGKLKSNREVESFNTSFNILKKQRENADYSEVVISEDMAKNALRDSRELNSTLSKLG